MRCFALIIVVLASTAHAEEPAAGSGLDAMIQRAKPVLDGVEHPPVQAPLPTPGDPLVVDRGACVELALKNSAQAAISEEDVAQAEARIAQAKAGRLPQIKAQVGGTYMDGLEGIKTSKLLENVVGVGDLQPDKLITRGTVSVEQVFYAGGQISNAVKASKFLAESQEWKHEVTRSQIAFDATQAYHDAMLTHALVEVAKDSVNTFTKHVADAKHVVDVGMASKIVLLRANTELGAREADLTSASTAEEVALLNLKRILALPEGQRLVLSGDAEWRAEQDSLEALIARAKGSRPELLALEKGIEAAEAGVRVKKGAYLPRAAGTVQWQEGTGTGALQPNGFSATAGIEWQLYAGGKRKGEVLEAESQVRALQKQREDVERLVELDVRQAYLRVNDAIEKIRRDKGTVALAEEGFRLASVRFKEGVGTQTEMLDAELALTQAKTKLAQAVRDYEVANASLDKATAQIVAPLEAPDAKK